MAALEAELACAVRLARAAGAVLLERLARERTVSSKGVDARDLRKNTQMGGIARRIVLLVGDNLHRTGAVSPPIGIATR